MKAQKSIGNFLFKNSVVMVLLSIVVFFATSFICKFVLESVIFRNISLGNGKPQSLSEYPAHKVNFDSIKSFGGWVEILNDRYKIIDVEGNKQDNIRQYDVRQLLGLSSALHNQTDSQYIYEIYPFTGSDGMSYIYIAKLPETMYSVSISINAATVLMHPNSMIFTVLAAIIGLFLAAFLMSMYFYSKFTARHIKLPLKYLMSGIREMENQNYKFRMQFFAESEFACIRDAFNHMAQKLEKYEKEKKQFEEDRHRIFVDISHDLKTPMTSICGFSKLLYDGEYSCEEDKNRYISYIYNKSNYVSELINDLFELSKLEDEKFTFAFDKDDIAEWLRQLVSEIYAEFENKNFILEIDISETPIIVAFDSRQLERAMNNLLNNALKHNFEKTSVKIYCHEESDNAVLRVSDNGVGIPDKLKNRIFEPFVCSDDSISNHAGTGLGLAIAKSIVERHNGSITLSSDSEFPTVFSIIIPLGNN